MPKVWTEPPFDRREVIPRANRRCQSRRRSGWLAVSAVERTAAETTRSCDTLRTRGAPMPGSSLQHPPAACSWLAAGRRLLGCL